ncbi:MAG: low molecular weight protein tyrosine phosphatase family protein [Devosia sp.]
MNALFVCSRNRLRSPTAEQIFATWPDVDTDSAGLAPDAGVQLSSEQIEWADIIFVMERSHQAKLKGRFRQHIDGKRIVCLDIPDKYRFMAPELVALLEQKVGHYLR